MPKVIEKPLYNVCIDPGHGDWDYGAISPNDIAEKDITLSIALKLGKLLEDEGGFKVIYTRATDKMDWIENANDSLKERIKISEISKADIFISLHCNYSSESNEILGVETWYNPSDDNSLTLSKYLQQSLIDLDYTTNRGLKSYVSGEELAVLELNTATSSLVELGFLTNSSDEKYLSSNIHTLTGMNFAKFRSIYRINHAKQLLNNEAVSICEAAFSSGFSSINTFNRVFKEFVGTTPTDYRKGIKKH